MKTLAFLMLLIGVLAALCGMTPQQQPKPDNGVVANITSTFAAYDVFIDSHAAPLAAWQIEIKDTRNTTQIVGIEGGEAGPYAAAPHYDPRAMQHEHVLIGAFSTAATLPSGRTRVARIHVLSQDVPQWQTQLMTAGTASGEKIDATVSLQPVQGDGK